MTAFAGLKWENVEPGLLPAGSYNIGRFAILAGPTIASVQPLVSQLQSGAS